MPGPGEALAEQAGLQAAAGGGCRAAKAALVAQAGFRAAAEGVCRAGRVVCRADGMAD